MVDPLNPKEIKEAIETGKAFENLNAKDKLLGHILDQKVGEPVCISVDSACPVDRPCKKHIPIVVETVSQTPDGNEINSDTALLDDEQDLRGLYEFLCHIHRLSSGPLVGIEILEVTDTEVKNEALFSFDFQQQCSTYFKRMNKVAFPVKAPPAPVYLYLVAESQDDKHIGKLKVVEDVVTFVNEKAYFALPFTEEEAEGIIKFINFLDNTKISDTIGDIHRICSFPAKDWEKQLELDQIESGAFSKENHNASDI